MSLFSMFTASIRKAVAEAVVGGVHDGVKRVLEGAEPQGNAVLEHEEAQALLLAFAPPAEEVAPVKGRRKAE